MQYNLNQPFNHLTNHVWEHIHVGHRAQDQMSELDAMNAAREGITADHCRDVCGIQGDFPPGAWQWKTSDVMLMKIFDLTNKSDRVSTKKHLFHGCYFVFVVT